MSTDGADGTDASGGTHSTGTGGTGTGGIGTGGTGGTGARATQVSARWVRWRHKAGGTAHCLARLVLRPAPAPPVIVLTELATNADVVGLTTDFGGAATSAVRALDASGELDPQAIVWLAHHGEFSSYDATGAPETLTQVSVTFDGSAYHCDLADHRLLPTAEAEAWRQALALAAAPSAVALPPID